jgi:hypothetical protein
MKARPPARGNQGSWGAHSRAPLARASRRVARTRRLAVPPQRVQGNTPMVLP